MDRSACPRCGIRALELGWCRNCRADLSTPAAQQVWELSLAAVRAIEDRQSAIATLPELQRDAVPQAAAAVAGGSSRPIDAPPPPLSAPASVGATTGASSQVSVQSVMAV